MIVVRFLNRVKEEREHVLRATLMWLKGPVVLNLGNCTQTFCILEFEMHLRKITIALSFMAIIGMLSERADADLTNASF